MKKNINNKIKQFLTSEVGRAGIRAPLVLGVAGSAFLLSQVMHTPIAEASYECHSNADCGDGETCQLTCSTGWSDGTCDGELGSECS